MNTRSVSSLQLALGLAIGLAIAMPATTEAAVVDYELENVTLDRGNTQIVGAFTWTYDIGDFENGVGEFTNLEIPFTTHDHTDLEINIDVGSSIEFTLPGNVHDDGLDITLFLDQPLTPTSGSALDLDRSAYEIGGGGIVGGFLSGDIILPSTSGADNPSGLGITLSTYPNPFRSQTTLQYVLAQAGPVRISILDVNGRVVTSLLDEWHLPGRYSVPWFSGELDSGLYFVKFTAGATSETLKIVLLP